MDVGCLVHDVPDVTVVVALRPHESLRICSFPGTGSWVGQGWRRSLLIVFIANLCRVTHWEYKLIHLNVESPAGGASAGHGSVNSPAASPPAARPPHPPQSTSLFSKAYLEHEFPDFYTHDPGLAQAAQSSNPVLQLQSFLNTHGQDGWCLIGFYNIGPLLLMAFRRRLDDKSPASPSPGDHHPLLHEILERIRRLEEDLGRVRTSVPSLRSSSEEVWVLTEQQYRALPQGSLCTTAEASSRLGFRSTVSLGAFLRRHNYVRGLVKMGSAGWSAVYAGSGPPTGRRRQHRWLIMKTSDINCG